MYYAQIDSDGIVYAITQTGGKVDQPDMILIDGFDVFLLGMRYENGKFVPVVD